MCNIYIDTLVREVQVLRVYMYVFMKQSREGVRVIEREGGRDGGRK